MPVTTLKRCQSDAEWWFTVEDCNVEIDEEPGSGLCIRYHDEKITKANFFFLFQKKMRCCFVMR